MQMQAGNKSFARSFTLITLTMKGKTKNILAWALRIMASIILLQTLFFKFSAAEESIFIFEKLGMEPWGRIGTGVFELIASLLILIPATTFWGAALAGGLMAGALGFHITILGISVLDDGGKLFIYALIVFVSSIVLMAMYRHQALRIYNHLVHKRI